MADFKKAHAFVMGNEGGYANNPSDRGGETYKGISRKIWPNWDGWASVDMAKRITEVPKVLNAILQENGALQTKVLAFYQKNFWDSLSLSGITNEDIATEMYDTGVNMGIPVEAKFLQRALNLTNRNELDYADILVDGKIGAITLECMNKHRNQKLVLKVLNIMQGGRYIDIMEKSKSQEIFANAWFSRVAI